jgi:hypothetical protein
MRRRTSSTLFSSTLCSALATPLGCSETPVHLQHTLTPPSQRNNHDGPSPPPAASSPPPRIANTPRYSQDKLVNRFSKAPSSSSTGGFGAAGKQEGEEYGYALPLGSGIERCPMPEFAMPSTADVSLCPLPSTLRKRHADFPRLKQPLSFLQLHTDDASDPDCRIKIKHGTTTLAFKYQGGIVVAVDSRATAGSYIGSLSLSSRFLPVRLLTYLLRPRQLPELSRRLSRSTRIFSEQWLVVPVRSSRFTTCSQSAEADLSALSQPTASTGRRTLVSSAACMS